ncbi:hypothetical protein IM538_03980 [Cytobacillus suaedae]|nr:hypothetical protein IM538_03980 [Cytobacillus suaedae]
MKKIVILFTAIFLLYPSTQPTIARQPFEDVVSNFLDTLVTKGEREVSSFLESGVVIPEIRENTPIDRFSVAYPKVPISTNENKRVAIGYFNYGETQPEQIAFIWEVTLKKDKISNIRVVFDGSNPMMNESKVVEEYEANHHKKVVVPSHFPFSVTHVDGYVDRDILMLRYRNEKLQATLQIKIVPKDNVSLERIKSKHDKYYTLRDGTKALYQPNYPPAHQIVFEKNDLRYYVGINKSAEMNIAVNDLIKIADSMLNAK